MQIAEWEGFREQLDEAAAIVAVKLRTCAFCGLEGNPKLRQVTVCAVCRCPTCASCLLVVSTTPDGLTCRHSHRSTLR